MTCKNSPSSISLFLRLFKNNGKKRAYTLLEMSIVLVVFSVLVTGGITLTTSMMGNAKKEVSNQRIATIYEAMGRFVAENKRLPCPASITIAKSEIGYGQESSGDCILRGDAGIYSSTDVQNIVYGMVPVNSLGLSDDIAEDGFGSKFSYVVNSHLTVRDDPSSYVSVHDSSIGGDDYRQGFGLYRQVSNEALNVTQLSSGNSIGDVAFAIIGHGANKNGAFSAESSAQNNVSANQDDYFNVSRQPSEGIGGAIGRASFGKLIDGNLHLVVSNARSASFDDLMMFKTRNDLVSDFNLANLMPCIPGESMQNDGFSIAYSGETASGNACDSFASLSPKKLCGTHGDWIDKSNCPSTVASLGKESAGDSNLAIVNSGPLSTESGSETTSSGSVVVDNTPFSTDEVPAIPADLALPGGTAPSRVATTTTQSPTAKDTIARSVVVERQPAAIGAEIDDSIVASTDPFTIDGVLLPFDIP